MMTLEEFFKQPAPVVGAVAALLVALISALTVIVGALVNARSAKIVARDTFRRELLFENLKPFLKRLDETIVTFQAIIDAGPALAGGLDEVGRAAPDERTARIEAVLEKVTNLPSRLRQTKELWQSTSGMSLIGRDQRLVDMATDWLRSINDFWELMKRSPFGITADQTRTGEMEKAASEVLWKTVAFRMALEDVVVKPPSWWALGLYRAKRRLKKPTA